MNQNFLNFPGCEDKIAEIQGIVAEITNVNQLIMSCDSEYLTESLQMFTQHVQSLMRVKSPTDFTQANTQYFQEQTSRYQQLIAKRVELFTLLSQKITGNNNVMNMFPQQLQETLTKFMKNGQMDLMKPDAWQKFSSIFQSK